MKTAKISADARQIANVSREEGSLIQEGAVLPFVNRCVDRDMRRGLLVIENRSTLRRARPGASRTFATGFTL